MHRVISRMLRPLSVGLSVLLFIAPGLAGVIYTVKSGDTLSKIAQRYSVPQNTIIAVNQLRNPHSLSIGQKLTIPVAAPKSTATTVKPTTPAAAKTAVKTPVAPPAATTNPRALAEARAKLLAEKNDKGQQLASNAKNYLGTPYVWSGTTSRGMDCSGLVFRSMAMQGKNVPHNAAQLYKMGEKVSYEQLQPGDLVFFITNGRSVSHVGIWVGEHKFIHASCKRGVVVQKMEGYYSKTLVGARRIH